MRRLRRRYGRSAAAKALADARRELRAKTREEIDLDTAEKWAARAVAADERFRETGAEKWHEMAIEFAHEAIEHAASGPAGSIAHVKRIMGRGGE